MNNVFEILSLLNKTNINTSQKNSDNTTENKFYPHAMAQNNNNKTNEPNIDMISKLLSGNIQNLSGLNSNPLISNLMPLIQKKTVKKTVEKTKNIDVSNFTKVDDYYKN